MFYQSVLHLIPNWTYI